MYETFLSTFWEIYEINFPYKQVTVKPKDVKSPWMSKALKKSSSQKQILKYLKQKTTESEKTYTVLIKKAKNNFYIKNIKMSRKYQEIMANNERNNR